MIIIPVHTVNNEFDALIVIMGKDNLDRMKTADPAEINLRSIEKLVNPTILLCYEEPTEEMNRLVEAGDVKKLIVYLQRGWRFKPEEGDHDRGPERIADLSRFT